MVSILSYGCMCMHVLWVGMGGEKIGSHWESKTQKLLKWIICVALQCCNFHYHCM